MVRAPEELAIDEIRVAGKRPDVLHEIGIPSSASTALRALPDCLGIQVTHRRCTGTVRQIARSSRLGV